MTSDVETYVTWRGAYHGLTENRMATIRRVLNDWHAHIGDEIPSVMHLETFLAGGTRQASTVLKHLKIIRAYLAWQRRHKRISADTYLDLMDVQAPHGATYGKPKPYKRGEMRIFWREFDEAYPWCRRDETEVSAEHAEYLVKRYQLGKVRIERILPYARRLQAEALVAVALFGGVRRGEIHRMSLVDAHYQNDHLRIVGAAKNAGRENIVRVVPMVRPMRQALGNWIEFRAQVLEPEHDALWLVLRNPEPRRPLPLDSLHEILDKVGDGYHLHRLRHTFATERLRAGVEIEVLQKLMGHSNISMTLRYADIDDDDVLARSATSDDAFVASVGRERAA